MSKIRGSTLLRALNISISIISDKVIVFTIFIVYVLIGEHLSAEKVFVTMAIFNTIRLTMTFFFPNMIGYAAEIYVSCKRVQVCDPVKGIQYKDSDLDVKKNSDGFNIALIDAQMTNRCNDGNSIIVDNLSAKWDIDSDIITLQNISCSLQTGELLAVVGPVGSGKSSFLMSLMNEIEVTTGAVKVEGIIAYAPQESWAFNATILQNILFGKPYEFQKFRQIMSVCAMDRDLKQFPFGEKTLVGERGVSLSGGQKARLTLARALYSDADIYLLDDPLSAVDSDVAKHIFEKCITGYLKSKAVVLVTHQIQFIQKATKILVLKEGRPLAFGSYKGLCESGIDFMNLIQTEVKSESKSKSDEIISEELMASQ
ncbi:unnamed protein product, partial [Oppiella nova]